MDVADNWTTQLRKGLLELCILNVIGRERIYGYDIVKQLRGIDALVIREGTIYPILSRLKRDGLVKTSLEESPEGPARRYYELSKRGEQLLDEMNAYWDVLTNGIGMLRKGVAPMMAAPLSLTEKAQSESIGTSDACAPVCGPILQ